MSDACVILDDRPMHIQPIRDEVRRAGAVPEVAKHPRSLMRKIKEVAGRGDLRGILLDNYIDDFDDLSSLGVEDSDTDNGTTAGYRIAVDVLIPKMLNGELPQLPIGIMSANDVSRVKDEFEASGKDRYPDLFFFRKEDVSSTSGDARAFFDALEPAGLDDVGSEEDRNIAYVAVAESFRMRFNLKDAEMQAIFSLTDSPSYGRRVRKGALSADSSSWQDMASVLLSIQSLLARLYRDEPDADALGESRLRNHRLMSGRHTGLELLMTGRILRALEVADELTLAAEPLRVRGP
jgi:hypothetical protein